ncbi:MAG: pyridoxamine 5'-phosphate oxidase family protein [Bacillota bacterium]
MINEKLNEVLMFANQNPSSWFSTSENNQPRVRGMLMWFADETGFYFHTGTAKKIYSEIQANPKVEVAFIRNPSDPINFEMLRVTGSVEMLEDEELKKRLFQERAWLWDNINRAGVESGVAIFRIVKGSAYIWNMSYNLRESEAPRVSF